MFVEVEGSERLAAGLALDTLLVEGSPGVKVVVSLLQDVYLSFAIIDSAGKTEVLQAGHLGAAAGALQPIPGVLGDSETELGNKVFFEGQIVK